MGLEMMEHRDVPSANLVWTAGGDGTTWGDADNWTEFNNGQLSNIHRTPTSTDTLWFGSLGGSNSSSVDDIDVTVSYIIQDSSFTGDLLIAEDATLTVTNDFTVHGAVEIEGEVDANRIFLSDGSITIASLAPAPITTDLLNLTSGAAFTVTMVWNGTVMQDAITLDILYLTMASGTTFDLTGLVTLDGSVQTAGAVTFVEEFTSLFVHGYSQTAGDLILPDDSNLSVDGTAPTYLSGHTIISGDATITADTVQVDGFGVLELSDASSLEVEGDLEIRSGTLEFATIDGDVTVTGNFSVFIGTLNMNVSSTGASNQITVGGTATVNQSGTQGGTHPELNLTQIGTITSPTTFNLIISAGSGSGDFNTISATNTVSAHGFTTVGNNDVYQVTL